MFLDYEPGDYVVNPKYKNWGIGQIQSIKNNKVTVNFENFNLYHPIAEVSVEAPISATSPFSPISWRG